MTRSGRLVAGATPTPISASFVLITGLIVLGVAAPVRPIAIVPAALFIAIIAIDHIWTRIGLSRLQIEASAPVIAIVGDDITVRLTTSRGHWGTRVLVGSPPAEMVHLRDHCNISFDAGRVGIHRAMSITVRVTSIGVASTERTIQIPLARALYCGPRLDGAVESPFAGAVGGESATRNYIPGDRPNRINWAATARTGDLLVRSAGADEDELMVVVDAGDGQGDADVQDLDWLWRPASTIAAWWETGGGAVRLITTEAHRDVSAPSTARSLIDAPVHERQELLRRLACVAPGRIDTSHYPDALIFAAPTVAP